MGQRVNIELYDDLDNGQAAEDTHVLSYNGVTVELDLSAKNAEKLQKALAPYLEAGRKPASQKPKTASARRPVTSGRTPEELSSIREWAAKNGHEVAPRGRIKQSVLDAYDAAH